MSRPDDPSQPSHPRVERIPPGAYPVFSGAAASQLLKAIRDPEVHAEATRVIGDSVENIHGAVLGHIDRVEAAAGKDDFNGIYEQAHEIRGLAGNAGLNATARIANGLCRYLDAVMRAGRVPERAVIGLHLDAIARAARAEDEATKLGDAVANELAQLVNKKLAALNDPETA
jgi:HPt (histidine-containing phosphotransfer) domain-containing protein